MDRSLLSEPELFEQVMPLSVQVYHKLCEISPEFISTELIEGVVFKKMTKSTEHSFFSELLVDLISRCLPGGVYIRVEKPLTIGNSEPEPDIAVVKGDMFTYKNENPTTALLVIEIARTSAIFDRLKVSVYAKANIPNYWIVHTVKKQVEVYSTPKSGKYTAKQILKENDDLPIFQTKIPAGKIWNN